MLTAILVNKNIQDIISLTFENTGFLKMAQTYIKFYKTNKIKTRIVYQEIKFIAFKVKTISRFKCNCCQTNVKNKNCNYINFIYV